MSSISTIKQLFKRQSSTASNSPLLWPPRKPLMFSNIKQLKPSKLQLTPMKQGYLTLSLKLSWGNSIQMFNKPLIQLEATKVLCIIIRILQALASKITVKRVSIALIDLHITYLSSIICLVLAISTKIRIKRVLGVLPNRWTSTKKSWIWKINSTTKSKTATITDQMNQKEGRSDAIMKVA